MQPSSESLVIRTFTSGQWDVRGNPKPVNVFAAFGGKRLWVSLIAFVILANLGGLLIALLVLAFIGLFILMTRTAAKLSPQQQFANDLLADVNDCVVELTGNEDSRISVKNLVALRESGDDMPLPVNGISGLSLRVVTDGPRQERVAAISRVADRVWTTRVIISASPPDYGTASFDRLLAATLDDD
ncbi:hypothetical protein FBY31_3815 [Arthrobacter sp. SLBN-100]|uniref:hypothetical protein n=1 Tax=Arthrobacter sp. SLBN-100 TaxID=2768450 RepID=UPI00114D8C17|nr:hypothetical protein [Arthrobacter sp. SLBN-100]TQJ69658.1 hypothetical protein FBY31_3815 [Arthrobacter sp. SLBN-100]